MDNLALMLFLSVIALLAILIFGFSLFKNEVILDTNIALLNGDIIIDQFFEGHFSRMETLTLSDKIIQMDPEGSRPRLEGLLQKDPELIEMALISTSGQEVLKVSRHQFIPWESLKSHAGDTHLQDSLAGERSIGDVVFEEGRPKVQMTVPVRLGPNRITGVMEATVDLRFLSEWIGKSRFRSGGAAFLVSREGRIIAHSEPAFGLGETRAGDIPSIRAAVAGRKVVPYGPNSRYRNLLGKRVVAGAMEMKPYGYVLVMETDENELIFQILPFFLGLTGVAFLAITATFFWAVFLVRRRVIQPVARLSGAMQEFEQKKEFTPLTPISNDEIGAISESFNEMARSLSDTLNELSSSQSQLTTILENITQGVFLLNPDGLIEYANLTVAKELNMLPGDLIGKDMKRFIPSGYQEKFAGEWERMRRNLTPFSFELEYYTGRGKLEPGVIFFAPLSTPETGFSGAVLLGVNLTRVKEEEEKRVKQERLATLGLLAPKLSHELRNPLGAMGNSIYFLKENLKNGDPKLKRHLEILEQQVAASTHLISTILDFARPRSPAIYPVNLNQVLQQAMEQVSPPGGIEIEQRLDSNLPLVQGDAQLLTQVFINLVTNACQAMPKGGKVTISTAIRDDAVVAQVQDTGTGIDSEFMKKLFQPFQSSKARGMGLGLSISKDIIERHKGRIEVQSEAGRGTTFSVHLPLKNGAPLS